MEFEIPYLIGFIIIIVLPLVIWGYLLYTFQKLQKNPKTSYLLIFGVVTIFFGIYLGFINLYSVWLVGYFGILSCLFFPILGVVALFLLVYRKKSESNSNAGLTKIALISVTFILLLILSPLISILLESGCDALHRRQALPLINAVEQYKSENNEFPINSQTIVPNYLKEMPGAVCLLPIDIIYGTRNDVSRYQIVKCNDEERAFVVVRTTLFGNKQIYSLTSHEWGMGEDWDNPCDKYIGNQ
jgi:hypothetical protein